MNLIAKWLWFRVKVDCSLVFSEMSTYISYYDVLLDCLKSYTTMCKRPGQEEALVNSSVEHGAWLLVELECNGGWLDVQLELFYMITGLE